MRKTVTLTVYTGGGTAEGDAVFVPISPPMPTHGLTAVRFAVEFLDDDDVEVAPGIQYGDTPLVYGDRSLTWDAPVKPNGTITWGSATSAPEWVYFDDFYACPDDFGTSQADRMFARLGLWVKNKTGGTATSDILACGVRVRIHIKSIVSGTVVGGPTTIPVVGSSTRLFTPLTDAIPLEDIGKVRASWEVDALADTVDCVPACEVSNDGVTWSSAPEDLATILGVSARTSEGVTFGTSFEVLDDSGGSPFRDSYEHVRFGASAKNAAESGNPGMVMVRIRIDWRDS